MTISVITTCKSRLEHLKQTIHSWKGFRPDEIIVVDVSCPDGTKDWLAAAHPDVRCISVSSPSFHLASARNIGAANALSEYLFFVDADIILEDGLGDWLSKNMHAGRYYSRAQETPYEGIHEQGTFLCHRAHFEKIMGYDETFDGYGGEDHDIYFKLNRIGITKENVPKNYISSIDHSDSKRTEHYVEKNKFKQSVINRIYAFSKEKILDYNPKLTELPEETRKKIWSEIITKIRPGFEDLEGDLMTIKLSGRKWLPEPYYLEVSNQISINIRRR